MRFSIYLKVFDVFYIRRGVCGVKMGFDINLTRRIDLHEQEGLEISEAEKFKEFIIQKVR